jgi:hypothetical protein
MAEAVLKSDPVEERPVLPVLFYQKHKRVFVNPLDSQLEIGRPRRIDRTNSA